MKRSILALLMFFGCSGPRAIDLTGVEAPDNVTHLGVLAIDSSGVLINASGLGRRSPGASYLYLPEGDRTPAALEIVGFTSDQIASVAADVSDTRLWSEPLRAAGTGARVMPAPIFSARFDLEGTKTGSAAMRSLTAPWMSPCPLLSDPKTLPPTDASCGSTSCLGTLEQIGCRLTFRAGCGLGEVQGTVDASGKVTFDPSSTLGQCQEQPTLDRELLTVACDRPGMKRCELHVYQPPPAEPLFAVSEVVLETVPPPAPAALFRPPPGYIHGLVGLDDRLIAATSGDRIAVWFYCDPTFPWRFHLIDPDTLTTTSTPSPACVSRLARDPMGPGFLAIFGGNERRIGRFDVQGRLQSSVAITDNESKLTPRHHASSLITTVNPARVLVLYSFEDQQVQVSSYLARIDPQDLTLLDISETIIAPTPVMGPAGPNAIAVADTNVDVTHIFDLDTLELIEDRRTRDECSSGIGVAPSFYGFDAATDQILIGTADSSAGSLYFMPRADGTCQGANVVEREGQAMDGIAWARGSWMIAASSGDGIHTRVALADPAGRRILPGSQEIGMGPATHLLLRGERVFMSLPWTAKVVRIEASR